MGLIAQQMYATGGVVKADPLPPGRYWIDIFEKDVDAWVAWNAAHVQTVHVEKTEFFEGDKTWQYLGWVYPWVPGSGNMAAVPDRAFVIFTVSAPTEWGIADRVGWPSEAPAGQIESSDDTVQKPDPEDTLPAWHSYVKWGLIGGGAILGLFAISSVVKSFKE